ncbi:MAG: SDR family oxidoreductase [Clostridia bacterium]|nr:SDR family oxidoreductase [Clostridia bacterium]
MSQRKVALVTGASSGIGMGIALELADQGYDIAFSYRNNEEGAQVVKARIEAKGAACRYYQARMEDGAAPAALVDAVHADFGRIDAMVCNAAKDRRFSILNATAEDFAFMTAQLYSGQMLCAGAAARHMIRDGIQGAILFITSIHGQMPTSSDFCYGGMKAAVERSAKSLALELSPYRIRVNCIAPGAINVRHRDDSQLKYPYAEMVPMGRWGVEEDIAYAAAFLLSDKAFYISGETLRVDGAFALPGLPEGWAQAYPVDKGFVQRAYDEMMSDEGGKSHV